MTDLPDKYNIIKIELSAGGNSPTKTLKIAKMLLEIPPRELEEIASLDQNSFKKLVDSILDEQEKLCLEALKKKLGFAKEEPSLLSRIYRKTVQFFRFASTTSENVLQELAPLTLKLNLSADLAIAENPNPILVLLPRYFPNLRSINLNSCNVTRAGVQELKKLPHLESISMSLSDHLHAEVLIEISTLEKLKELKLSWNRHLPLEVMEALTELKTLEKLDLSHTNITDHELYFIAKIPRIEILQLDSCPAITDEGVKTLKSLKNLHYLSVLHCSHLSPDVIDLFSPDIEIKAA